MFDIGFWEIAVIGVIALLVVGPERLPAVARNVGRWVGQVRRYVSHVKQDIEREIHADEVRDLLEKPDGLAGIRDVARETTEVFDETRKELHNVAAGIKSTSSRETASEPKDDAHSAVASTPASDSSAPQADGDSVASTSNDSPADEQQSGQPRQQ